MNHVEGFDDLPYNIKLCFYLIIRGFEEAKHPIPTIEDLIQAQPMPMNTALLAYWNNKIKS